MVTAVSILAARSASRGHSNSTWSGSPAPNSRFTRLTSATAMSELPPAAKNSSAVETGSYFSAVAQIAASRRSVGVAGATNGAPVAASLTCSAAASALASTLPLAVSGSSSSTSTRLGTM